MYAQHGLGSARCRLLLSRLPLKAQTWRGCWAGLTALFLYHIRFSRNRKIHGTLVPRPTAVPAPPLQLQTRTDPPGSAVYRRGRLRLGRSRHPLLSGSIQSPPGGGRYHLCFCRLLPGGSVADLLLLDGGTLKGLPAERVDSLPAIQPRRKQSPDSSHTRHTDTDK